MQSLAQTLDLAFLSLLSFLRLNILFLSNFCFSLESISPRICLWLLRNAFRSFTPTNIKHIFHKQINTYFNSFFNKQLCNESGWNPNQAYVTPMACVPAVKIS